MRIGPTERYVLLSLATRGASTATDWGAWYPLNLDQARGALYRLGRRGLIDPAGWDGAARLYKLTERGVAAVAEIERTDDE